MQNFNHRNIMPRPPNQGVGSIMVPDNLYYRNHTQLNRVVELPQAILVETRIMSTTAAAMHNMDVSQMINLDEIYASCAMPTLPSDSIPNSIPTTNNIGTITNSTKGSSRKKPNDNADKVNNNKVKKATIGIMTDNPNPTRTRGQQTVILRGSFLSKATQCNLDGLDDSDFEVVDENKSTAVEQNKEIKTKFLEYAASKTHAYSNGKHECIICGEICLNEKRILKHMALHFGPGVLCEHCGTLVEHKSMLRKHDCPEKIKTELGSNKSKTRIYCCPYYRCRVRAISKLELYDHLNEHTSTPCYSCLGCRRRFHTAGEMQKHLQSRKQCAMAKQMPLPYSRFINKVEAKYIVRVVPIYSNKKKRVWVKFFLSKRTTRHSIARNRVCHVCLKYCSNEFKFRKHSKRCLQNLNIRIKRRNEKERNRMVVPKAEPQQNGVMHFPKFHIKITAGGGLKD